MARICKLTELAPAQPVALTIGIFDGVHRGHQALIGQAIGRARALNGQSAALTFYPHPKAVLSPGEPAYELMSFQDRLATIAALGIDVVATLEFTSELSRLSAETFLDLLQSHVNLRELWVGENFALGYRRSGTASRLRQLGAERGFLVQTIGLVDDGGVRISSSRIRDLIAGGEVGQAAEFLGRHYCLRGVVIRGHQRGRLLGFPTANLRLVADYLLPANGIYAVIVEIDGRRLPAVANVGVRPTFGMNERLVEAHILDFNADIYDQPIAVHLVKRLRDEERFASIDALIAHMHGDVSAARAALQSHDALPG